MSQFALTRIVLQHKPPIWMLLIMMKSSYLSDVLEISREKLFAFSGNYFICYWLWCLRRNFSLYSLVRFLQCPLAMPNIWVVWTHALDRVLAWLAAPAAGCEASSGVCVSCIKAVRIGVTETVIAGKCTRLMFMHRGMICHVPQTPKKNADTSVCNPTLPHLSDLMFQSLTVVLRSTCRIL